MLTLRSNPKRAASVVASNCRVISAHRCTVPGLQTHIPNRHQSTRHGIQQPRNATSRSEHLFSQLRDIEHNPHMTEADKLRNSTRIFAELECAEAWSDFDNMMRESLGGRIPLDSEYSFSQTYYLKGARIADTQWTASKLAVSAPLSDAGLMPRISRLLGLSWAALGFPVAMYQVIKSDAST